MYHIDIPVAVTVTLWSVTPTVRMLQKVRQRAAVGKVGAGPGCFTVAVAATFEALTGSRRGTVMW